MTEFTDGSLEVTFDVPLFTRDINFTLSFVLEEIKPDYAPDSIIPL